MVSKTFLTYALPSVYKQVITEPTAAELVDEIHELAADDSVFTEEEIKDNQAQLEKIDLAFELNDLVCYVDGAARRNPDGSNPRAGAAFIVKNNDEVILNQAFPLPLTYFGTQTSSHFAEYQAFISCLHVLSLYHPIPEELSITVYSDSKLLVNQVNFYDRTRSEPLRKLLKEARQQMEKFKKVTVVKIPREKNEEADALAGQLFEDKQWKASLKKMKTVEKKEISF